MPVNTPGSVVEVVQSLDEVSERTHKGSDCESRVHAVPDSVSDHPADSAMAFLGQCKASLGVKRKRPTRDERRLCPSHLDSTRELRESVARMAARNSYAIQSLITKVLQLSPPPPPPQPRPLIGPCCAWRSSRKVKGSFVNDGRTNWVRLR